MLCHDYSPFIPYFLSSLVTVYQATFQIDDSSLRALLDPYITVQGDIK